MVRPFAVAWVLFASLGVGLTGCVKSDLGTECVLVRKGDVDGGDAVAFLTNADVKKGQVYISYGATECEDLVCVRDENFPEDTANPGLPAKGYCSKLCVPQDGPTLNSNCPAANPDDNREDSPNRLSCRELTLDPETLAAYREADPEGAAKHFPPDTTPYYCARGTAPTAAGAP